MSLIYLSKRVAVLALFISAPAWASDPNSKCPITRADARAAVGQTEEQRMQEKDVRSESRFWAWWHGVRGKKPALPTIPEPHFIEFHNPAYDPDSVGAADPVKPVSSE